MPKGPQGKKAPPPGDYRSVPVLLKVLGFAYACAMTKLLEHAFEAVRQLSAESQDEIARAVLHLAAHDGEPEPIDPLHLAAVLEGLGQARRREFATDAEIEAAFRRFDP